MEESIKGEESAIKKMEDANRQKEVIGQILSDRAWTQIVVNGVNLKFDQGQLTCKG